MNEEEAQSVIDYVQAHSGELFKGNQTVALTSPYRPQSLLIKNTLTDREDVDKETKERFQVSNIGAFDEFVSRTFDTIIVSMCKTKNVTRLGGPLLNNPLNVQYLKSRALKRIIVIGKAKALNALWKAEFYEIAVAQNLSLIHI